MGIAQALYLAFEFSSSPLSLIGYIDLGFNHSYLLFLPFTNHT
jgi:hypothetical protein